MTDRPPITKRPPRRKSSLGATLRNTGMSTRHIYEMQVKTANYEAMMQRFQLRKVSDTGLAISKFQAKNLVVDKESGSVKKGRRLRFSLQRWMRSLTKRKTWRKFLRSLSSPITPSSRVATIHGFAMLCTYHFQLFYLPFGASYYPEGGAGISAINIVLEMIFLLNLLLNFNTAYHDENTLVTSRRLIAKNYLNRWFIVDFLSAIPRFGFHFFITGSLADTRSVIIHSETALMVLRVLRVTFIERTVLLSRVVRISKHMVAWLRFSRYSHLLGIAQLMWLVLLIAHYMACIWHVVSDNRRLQAEHVLEKYIADYYYAVSLIQGQGNMAGTRNENLYCTVSILVGSVILAIVFGNVAMLVSNFNASSTNYHRKMEAVFATMNKMKLPDKLRDRIHQYYTHVWTEYESLDGDIVKFQRELTHTLGLEVGLYKYMNLVTEIPFWKDCSPDFATQIILNLAVRVYLPDDYVIRKGETCDEMFMINRGICALSYTWESDSDSDADQDAESVDAADATPVTGLEATRLAFNREVRGSAKFRLPSVSKRTSMDDSSSYVRPQQYRLPGDVKTPETVTDGGGSTENGENSETQLMYPGETTGEMGLIMNHVQTGSIRAVTYVETCILDRATFQRLISRYPKDRRTVLTHMLRDSIEKGQFPFAWEELSDVVLQHRQRKGSLVANIRTIHATLTPAQAAQALVERLDVELPDETIRYGLQGSDKPLELLLPPVQGVRLDKPPPVTENVAGSHNMAPSSPAYNPPVVFKDDNSQGELLEMVRAMTAAISRMESDLQSMKSRLDQLPPAVATDDGAGINNLIVKCPPSVARRASDQPPPPLKRLERVHSSFDASYDRNDDAGLNIVSSLIAPIKPIIPRRVKIENVPTEADQAAVSTPMENDTSIYVDRSEANDAACQPHVSSNLNATNDSSEVQNLLFEKAANHRVLLHPISRMSIVDGASRSYRPLNHRRSIRRLLSGTFSKSTIGLVQPPDLLHAGSSLDRSRKTELSLVDQLWNRQSSENKLSDASKQDRDWDYSLHREVSARSSKNRDSHLQSFPEAPFGVRKYNTKDGSGSPGLPGSDAASGNTGDST